MLSWSSRIKHLSYYPNPINFGSLGEAWNMKMGETKPKEWRCIEDFPNWAKKAIM